MLGTFKHNKSIFIRAPEEEYDECRYDFCTYIISQILINFKEIILTEYYL